MEVVSNISEMIEKVLPHKELPLQKIPGDEPGIPFISVIRDRLDYYYNLGQDKYFQSRIDKYGSTIFRCNMPPGPFMASNSRVIAVLDAKAFPILFDVSQVEKKDLFTGTFMPSTKLTGGFRVCSYLDPSEPNHAKIKQMLFNLLASRKDYVIPAFRNNYSSLFDTMESQLVSDDKSDFNKLNEETGFDFLGDAYFGSKPSASKILGHTGPSKIAKWLLLQLHPLMTLGLPKIIEDLLLHTFHLPTFLANSDYKALYTWFDSVAGPILDDAEKLGLSRKEACHNLLFATCFNTYGGVKVLFPGILKWLALGGQDLHAKLAKEIREAVAEEGGKVTLSAIEKMELTQSVVYEALRMNPPVEFQYAKAKKDLIIESHDAKYQVKKGEMLFGYQPFATRDTRFFPKGDQFVGDRFVGKEGKKYIKFVYWSNGFETESPTLGNKQCAGKNFVVLIARLLVVEFFLRYDSFTAEISKSSLETEIIVKSLTRAKASSY